MTCPNLPDPEILNKRIINQSINNLELLIASKFDNNYTSTNDEIAKESFSTDELYDALKFTPSQFYTNVVSTAFFHMISTEDSVEPILSLRLIQINEYKYQHILLVLLAEFPMVAKECDKNGHNLLYYACSQEDLCTFRPIIAAIASLYPISISSYCCKSQSQRNTTPFHELLLREDVDYDLAVYLLFLCPSVARCEMEGGKLPLHILLNHPEISYYFAQTDGAMKLLRSLLVLHPMAAFREVADEIKRWRIESLDGNSLVLTSKVERWLPIDKLRSLHLPPECHEVFDKIIQRVAFRKSLSTWRQM